jgi:hypothetical protein
MSKKTTCEYCLREIDKRGMPSHIHFRHLRQYLVGFRLNCWVNFFMDTWPPRFEQKQLMSGGGEHGGNGKAMAQVGVVQAS